MGQYRLSFYFKLQISLSVGYDIRFKSIDIKVPFVDIHIGLPKEAKGIRFFRD